MAAAQAAISDPLGIKFLIEAGFAYLNSADDYWYDDYSTTTDDSIS